MTESNKLVFVRRSPGDPKAVEVIKQPISEVLAGEKQYITMTVKGSIDPSSGVFPSLFCSDGSSGEASPFVFDGVEDLS